MAHAQVNPQVLSWARQRAGLNPAVLARKLHVTEDKIVSWEEGTQLPTFRQAQNYAKTTHVPFGYLFLREPPREELPLPDLRTKGSKYHPERRFSLELVDTIREVRNRQIWYREYLQNENVTKNPIVGRATRRTPIPKIVTDMRTVLGVPTPPKRGTWEDYFRDLVARVEDQGILVMRNSMVGSNTHRPLSVEEFRGFAIADDLAPVIFINTADSPEARLFSLIHELAHIWLGQSGVSDAEPGSTNDEQLCNAIAAEFLVPQAEFTNLWQPLDNWRHNLAPLAAHFHVSQWVIARRALTLGYIDHLSYQEYVRKLLESYKKQNREGKPPFQKLQVGRVSKRLARAVASEALSGRLLLRDASQLIGIKPHRIASFARKELDL